MEDRSFADLSPEERVYYYELWGLDLSRDDGRSDGVVCKYCGRGGFHWKKEQWGWNLVTATGRSHRCEERFERFAIQGEGR